MSTRLFVLSVLIAAASACGSDSVDDQRSRSLSQLVRYDDQTSGEVTEQGSTSLASATPIYERTMTGGSTNPSDLSYVSGQWVTKGELFGRAASAGSPAIAVKRGLTLPAAYTFEARISLYDVIFWLAALWPSVDSHLVFDYVDAKNYKWAHFQNRVENNQNVLYCNLGSTTGGVFSDATPLAKCYTIGNAYVTANAAVAVNGRQASLSINGTPVKTFTYADAIDQPTLGIMNRWTSFTAFQWLKVY
jgi:hypothetical protein